MISIIFPTYNEEKNLEELIRRLDKALKPLNQHAFEFLFVDDCSTDKTPEILRACHDKDQRVKSIRFARNCGSHAAISAGLQECRGDCAIVMAADLQDPPEVIADLLQAWESGARLVWGVRRRREGESAVRKFFSRLYYELMNSLTAVKTPPSGADMLLADRTVIDAFRTVQEKHTSVFMTLAWLGFKQHDIFYTKERRFAGRSKWTLSKKIKLSIDSVLAFSDVPVRYMSVLGFATALTGFGYAIYVIRQWAQTHVFSQASVLLVAVLVIGGVQMMMLGILGEYLWRTFDESRKRPRYIVEYRIE